MTALETNTTYGPILDGSVRSSDERMTVHFPATGDAVAEFSLPTADQVEAAIEGLARAAKTVARMPVWKRGEILRRAAAIVERDGDHLAQLLVMETGKPRREADVEVARAVSTLGLGAETANHIDGEIVTLDGVPAGEGKIGEVRRFPVGPIAGITPFNSPFNLACHKVAGAIAAGCPFALKPSERTPLTTVELGRILLEAGWPPDGLAVLTGRGSTGEALVRDPRIRAIAFNGGEVGWHLKAIAGNKPILLELGGNGAVIVEPDADLELAARRCVEAGYLLAGQVCASVQRVYAHESVMEELVERVIAHTERQVVGDPREAETTVGPLISEQEAIRVASMVDEAEVMGARVLTGGQRSGTFIQPTVLVGVQPGMRVVQDEIFGPVIGVAPYQDLRQAIDAVNNSRFGMQAGIFTASLKSAYQAYRDLEVAGVIVNEVNAWRADPMPFGGEKDSGFGREGPRGLIDTFTFPKLLVINLAALGLS
jgi:acyl-CoA reductase-like NAD-dependent aldehyde dehydrogenase